MAIAGIGFWAQAAEAAGSNNSKLLRGSRDDAGGSAFTRAITPTNGPTQAGSICMQRVYDTPVTNANRLGCTASDIKISDVTQVSPSSCTKGSNIDLTATFKTEVTANTRYDAGFFFRIDGGTNARGDGPTASGTCSLSALTPGVSPSGNLDGDTCGDLSSGIHYLTFVLPQVECKDDNNDKKLDLPYCTSWHSNSGTVCNIADPSKFGPETKSKCVCNDNFQVPVTVEEAALTVAKTASPETVSETGGQVTFNVTVTNDSQVSNLTLASISDAPYGNLAAIPACTGGKPNAASPQPCTPASATTSCPSLINTVLGPGISTTCSFQAFIAGDAGDTFKDIVEVCGTGSSSGNQICKNDDATVGVTDAFTAPTLTKDALSATNCTADVEYQVVVNNVSATDTLTVTKLEDDKFGSITVTHPADAGFGEVVSTNCQVGGTIAQSSSYDCKFTGRIASSTCSFAHTNTITGTVIDDDNTTTTPADTATVETSTVLK